MRHLQVGDNTEPVSEVSAMISMMRVGELAYVWYRGHRFALVLTEEEGCNTGRGRVMVSCWTCGAFLHEATTGGGVRIRDHARGTPGG